MSNHARDSAVAVAAVPLGVTMIKNHFTSDRNHGSPNAALSMEPDKFKRMVDEIRIVEKALSRVGYSLTEKKKASRKLVRSSLVFDDVAAGAKLKTENERFIRPTEGAHARHLSEVLGWHTARDLRRGEPLGLGC